jgi:sulfhydrogenase subunit alpha
MSERRRVAKSRSQGKPPSRPRSGEGTAAEVAARGAEAGTGVRRITVEALARVEGEGGLAIRLLDGKVAKAELRIYEPPRFFEAFLRGRQFLEVPDITARICGICPIAYQMSACHALEAACGVSVDGQLRALRRLLYCGEWIESHALHVYMLHAPDFLGYQSGIHLAQDHPERVVAGLELKKIGNHLVEVLGGRSVHPVNVKVGGFYRVPARSELLALRPELERALGIAVDTAHWVAGFPFPAFAMDYDFVALRHPDEYPLNEGRLVSTRGLDLAIEEYEQVFLEEHVERSNALHSRKRDGGTYFVGPLARFNLNADRLTPAAARVASEIGLVVPECNPFRSILVRAVELVFACEEALAVIDAYRAPAAPAVVCTPRPAVGHGCTEAPRGILYHRYRISEQGAVEEAKIVPPTAQNQPQIEADLASFVESRLGLSDERLTWECEQAVRNYDPCISCATHFLKLDLQREAPEGPTS